MPRGQRTDNKLMRWRHFTDAEMTCRCGCGRCDMDAAFMARLDELRDRVGVPLVVTSGFRCQPHNATVGGSDRSAHLFGLAADIHVISDAGAYRLLAAALEIGVAGIGLRLHGPGIRQMIHLDDMRAEAGIVRPLIWTYA